MRPLKAIRWLLFPAIAISLSSCEKEEVLPNAGFLPRYGHSSADIDKKMWVIAGLGDQTQNDVWNLYQ